MDWKRYCFRVHYPWYGRHILRAHMLQVKMAEAMSQGCEAEKVNIVWDAIFDIQHQSESEDDFSSEDDVPLPLDVQGIMSTCVFPVL